MKGVRFSNNHFVFVESRSEFLEKLQRARGQVKPSTSSQPILSAPGPTKLTVGNWSLTCLKEGEIAIHNSDGQQATILKEDLPGFVFESNRGTKHSFTAETSLGSEFVTGWTGKRGRKLKSKLEKTKQKVYLWDLLAFFFLSLLCSHDKVSVVDSKHLKN